MHPEEHVLHDVLGGCPVTENERAQPDQFGPAAPEHLGEALRGRSTRLHAHHTNGMACWLPGEGFGLSIRLAYDEIAEGVGKSPAAVRQIAHRARAHVAARRPRGVVSPAETRVALEAFQRAAETGDLQRLLDILAPDVVFLGDGGGVKQAALAPIVEAGRVARLLAAGLDRIAAAASLHPAQVNGYPALILRLNREIDTVIAVRIDDGLITGLYAVRNPAKLSHMEQETTLRR